MEYLLDDPTVFVDMLPLTLPAVLVTQVRKLSASLDLRAFLQRSRSARTVGPSTLTNHRLVRRNAEAGIVRENRRSVEQTVGDDPMNAHEFYRDVAERAMLSKGEAADLTRAVLEVLAMRVSAGEVRHLIRQLPEELADSVRWNSKGPERFDLDDLILRVSSRTGLTKTETMTGVEAVLLTLREAVDRKEFNDFMSQLPMEFTRLLPSPNPPRAV
jgi:uncharacterized protein (DUF2267 family)